MRRLLLPLIAAFVLVLGLGTYTLAQDSTPPAGEEEENHCVDAMATPSAGTVVEASPAVATEEPAMGSPAAEEGCEIEIEDFAFVPQAAKISVGDTVTWENYDEAPHTATGDNGEFDSGNLATDQTFSHTFDTAGTFTYHCNVHPNMTGSIVVE